MLKSAYFEMKGNFGHSVDGSSVALLQATSIVECGAYCLERNGCFSFNFSSSKGICELLINNTLTNSDVITKPGFVFYQNTKE